MLQKKLKQGGGTTFPLRRNRYGMIGRNWANSLGNRVDKIYF